MPNDNQESLMTSSSAVSDLGAYFEDKINALQFSEESLRLLRIERLTSKEIHQNFSAARQIIDNDAKIQ